MKNRVLINKSDTITDISTSINNYHVGSDVVYLEVGDYLYIGQRHPFNHLYFNVSVVNTETSVLSMTLWDGNNWESVAEIIDETNGFANSGYITFTPNKDNNWHYEDSEDITGLTTIKIYDRYWARITTDADFSNTTAIEWMGSLSCSEQEFFAEYPSLSRASYLAAWETGKTTWEEQRVAASEMVINDLISKGIIEGSGNLVERYHLRDSTITKTAVIIFNALGDDYVENFENASKVYTSRIGMDIFRVDQNDDGRLSRKENTIRNGRLIR